jgi:hypothetical protein
MKLAHVASSLIVIAASAFVAVPAFAEETTTRLTVTSADAQGADANEPVSGSGPLTSPAYRPPTRPGVETTVFGLPKNMGPGDRIIRGLIAATLIGIGTYGFASKDLSPTLSGTLMGVSLIPAATAATGYCPLYQVFGLDYSF